MNILRSRMGSEEQQEKKIKTTHNEGQASLLSSTSTGGDIDLSSGTRIDHLSARILLTALEAQYGGSSCTTSSSIGSTFASAKNTTSDSSWTTASIKRKRSTSHNQNDRRPQHSACLEGVSSSCSPSFKRIRQQKTSRLVSDAGSGSAEVCRKRALLVGQHRGLEDVIEEYDGSVSSNNGSDSENDDADSFAPPYSKTEKLQRGALKDCLDSHKAGKNSDDASVDSSDILSFSSQDEDSAFDRKAGSDRRWDGGFSTGDENGDIGVCVSLEVPSSKKCTTETVLSSAATSKSCSRVAVKHVSQDQTVANGIAILERSVKSKLAASGASSIKEGNQLRHAREHSYQEQARSMALGIGSSTLPSGTPHGNNKLSSSPNCPFQMHQTAGVPSCPSFLKHHRLFGPQQQQHHFSQGPGFQRRMKPASCDAPIYNVGVDILVQCLSFLEPAEVLSTLTYPLSKTWRQVYCKQGQLWKVLCIAEPFHAKLGSSTSGSDDEGNLSMTTSSTASEMRNVFGQYRLLYTSFVRCITYVNKIQREASRLNKDQVPPVQVPQLHMTSPDNFSELPSESPSASVGMRALGSPTAPLRQQDLPSSFGTFLARAREVVDEQQRHASNFEGGTIHVDSGAESPQSSLSASCLSSSSPDSSSDDESLSDAENCEVEQILLNDTTLNRPSTGFERSDMNVPDKRARLDSVPEVQDRNFARAAARSISSGNSRSSYSEAKSPKTGPTYAPSKLTAGLLGSNEGKSREPGHVDLPWSCAVYAVINWMVAFSDVLGIQVTCLKALPSLLEDERQRSTAQLAGLTGIVIRSMVTFRDSVELHTAAFHTLVLLARPLGGKEGMLFHRTMVGGGDNVQDQANQGLVGGGILPAQQPQPRGIFEMGSVGQATSTGNGTAVILDSMRRFATDEALQAMSCWSMVNIALIPSQKSMLVRLGGIGVTAQAMMMHPLSAEVQFRALFALINLVIPCEHTTNVREDGRKTRTSIEKEMLDENVGKIAQLVVLAMKNFCTTKAILNRACLVLHNLSLNREYHSTLLWIPSCYEMLQWTMTNYPNDKVIEQSASGTLQRLQQTLREDGDLRQKFCVWLNRTPQSIGQLV